MSRNEVVAFFLFYSQRLFVITVLRSFLKTSKGQSAGPQLEKERHLLCPSPEAGEEAVGASSVVPTSSHPLSSAAVATHISLLRHLQL